MVRVPILLIVCSLLHVQCSLWEEMDQGESSGFEFPSDFNENPAFMEVYNQYGPDAIPSQPKTSSVKSLRAMKKTLPDGYEVEVESGVDQTGEISYQVEPPVEKQKKTKKFKTPKVLKKFFNLFKRKTNKQKKAEEAEKRAKAEKKSKKMPQPEYQPEYQPEPQPRYQPVPEPVPQPRFEPAPQPRFQPVTKPRFRPTSQPAPTQETQKQFRQPTPQDIFQQSPPVFAGYSSQRLPTTSIFKRPIQTSPSPIMRTVEIQLEKVDSNPVQGFVRTVNYDNGRPIVREKRINYDSQMMLPHAAPIIFDPYGTLIHTSDGKKRLMKSLDEMFSMKRLGSSSVSTKKDEKKNFVPCEMRKGCEECTVDFSCYFCSSKKQCIPAKYFGSDSFTGYHCPASDIYYFETCRVKSFVFMFFMIIFGLCLIFAVLIMGFSLIYRRTRRAKIYNIIKEKEDELDSEGKPHPLID